MAQAGVEPVTFVKIVPAANPVTKCTNFVFFV